MKISEIEALAIRHGFRKIGKFLRYRRNGFVTLGLNVEKTPSAVYINSVVLCSFDFSGSFHMGIGERLSSSFEGANFFDLALVEFDNNYNNLNGIEDLLRHTQKKSVCGFNVLWTQLLCQCSLSDWKSAHQVVALLHDLRPKGNRLAELKLIERDLEKSKFSNINHQLSSWLYSNNRYYGAVKNE